MAQPVKKSNRAATPAPAPAPASAPAATKPAPKPVERKSEERKSEERKREKERSQPVKQTEPPALPGPMGSFAQPTPAQREATTARALGAQTASRAAKVEAITSSPPPVAKAALGGPETTAVYVPPEELEALKPYLTALGRVDELRRQGKIGERQSSFGGGYATPFLLTSLLSDKGSRGPAVRPVQVSPKQGREPLTRRPYASQVEMPTAEELDLPILAARKMQQVIRDRDLLQRQQTTNQLQIAKLEDQLSAARDSTTLDPTKSLSAQMEARDKEMEAISRQLKQMAAQQRGLQERILTKNATLREYGMTEEEINPK